MQQGYTTGQTKMMNKWHEMLLLNLKNGFDIMRMYKDAKGRHKIVLEKKLR